MQATLSRRFNSRITNSPTRSLGISFSPRLRSFSSMRAIDSSTESDETGRFLKANLRELASLSWLYSTRLPFFFTIAGRANSTRSQVVKRLSHFAQRRRRRIVSPSSETRVSKTWVSSLWQKGQRKVYFLLLFVFIRRLGSALLTQQLERAPWQYLPDHSGYLEHQQ